MAGILGDIGRGIADLTTGNIGGLANDAASALPANMWQGTPIRTTLGITPVYAAERNPLQTNTSVNVGGQQVPTYQAPTLNLPAATQSGGLQFTSQPTSGSGSSGGGTNYSFGNPNNPDLSNPVKQTDYNNYLAQMRSAASNSTAAQIQATLDQYNNLRAQLEAQKPVIQNTYDTGLANLNSAVTQSQAQAQNQKDELNNSTQRAMGTASQNYQETQGQNRELARAMGSFGTDYAQLQNRTSNNYLNQTGQMQSDLTSRINDINTNLTAMNQQAEAQKQQLATQYNQAMQQIVLNENQSDFAKADEINKIKADFGNQMANINNMMLQFNQQMELAKQQTAMYAALYGKAGAGYNPFSYAMAPLTSAVSSTYGQPQGVSGLMGSGQNQQQSQVNGLFGLTPDQQQQAYGGF